MQNIDTYIRESILSSTNAGKFWMQDQLKKFITEHCCDGNIESINILCDKDKMFYAIVDIAKNSNALKLLLDNPNSDELKMLQNTSGIYYKHKNKYHTPDIYFKYANNLKLDLSHWNKDKYHKSYTEQRLVFINCKNISILSTPTYFGKNNNDNDVLAFSDDCVITHIPKKLENVDVDISLSRNRSCIPCNTYTIAKSFEVSEFSKLIISGKFFTQKDECAGSALMSKYVNKYLHGSEQCILHKEYNEQFKQILKLNVNAQLLISNHKYIEYDANSDTYIFDDEPDYESIRIYKLV